MKVLFYSALSLRFGGGFEHWIFEIAPKLRKFGVDCIVVTTQSTVGDTPRKSHKQLLEQAQKTGIKYYELPFVSIPLVNSPVLSISSFKDFLSISRDCNLIYFVNAYAFQDLLIYFAKVLQNKPVISGHHATLFSDSNFHNYYMKTIGKFCLTQFDAFHVLNSHDELIFKRWGLNNIYKIPIGLDTSKFKPLFNKRNEIFRVLFVGRLTQQKGIDTLQKAIEILVSSSVYVKNKIQFIIVGSGPLRSEVKHFASNNQNVNYFEQVSDEHLLKIYQSCNLFVMPSRRETFGITALEAQSFGLPVIASNISGPSDIVCDGKTGTLIPVDSSEELADSILTYFDIWRKDSSAYTEISFDSRNNAIRRFDLETTACKMTKMFKDVANFEKSKHARIQNSLAVRERGNSSS